MFRALYTAASGMLAQQLNLDNIANNLANASTVGFRGSRLQFQDLIYQEMVVPGSAATQQTTVSAGLQIGLGTRAAASEVLQTQGDLDNTGNHLDMFSEPNVRMLAEKLRSCLDRAQEAQPVDLGLAALSQTRNIRQIPGVTRTSE